ncbi:MAG TPA: cupredoxin domain-containing protein [Actinomycetota bacterium]|nr:cupredoxin domain-containing protein [Actinomycetota bacterium]
MVDETVAAPTTAAPSPTESASPSPPANPVQLEGPVNNKEVRDLTGSGASVTLEMQLTDFAFVPTFVKVAPGANVRLTVSNGAPLADHTFTMDAFAIHRQLKPQETADLVIQLPQTGAFRFYCKLHADKGMQGAFYFNDGDQISAASMTPVPTGGTSTARSRSSTTRRSTGSAASGTSRTGRSDDDLEIPDLDINEPDADGEIEGNEGQTGSGGTRGEEGDEGQQGEEGVETGESEGDDVDFPDVPEDPVF